MMLPDVNVLISAFRRDASHHQLARAWLEGVVRSDAQFGISPLSLAAVVRITTGLRFFGEPSAMGDAIGFCDDIVGQPHCRLIEPGERHWGIFRRLQMETGIRGPMVADAWFAALAIEWGCEWISFDRDYARFRGLRWSVPAA
jgi:toxin-antitoxin system PIN domain toxin